MTWDFAPIALVALGLSGGSVHESVHANHGGRWIPATERCRLTADKRMPLTAEPLNPDDQHEIIRRVNQERDQAPGVWAEMQRAQRHRDVITLVAAALVLHGSTITTASMNAARDARAAAGRLANSCWAGPSSSHRYTRQTPNRAWISSRLIRWSAGGRSPSR
jgi:hypothetical protein